MTAFVVALGTVAPLLLVSTALTLRAYTRLVRVRSSRGDGTYHERYVEALRQRYHRNLVLLYLMAAVLFVVMVAGVVAL